MFICLSGLILPLLLLLLHLLDLVHRLLFVALAELVYCIIWCIFSFTSFVSCVAQEPENAAMRLAPILAFLTMLAYGLQGILRIREQRATNYREAAQTTFTNDSV